MKNSKMLKCLTFCFVFFMGFTVVASAQSRTQTKNADQIKQDHYAQQNQNPDVAKVQAIQNESGLPQIPGFVATGDPVADAVNYQNAKKALIDNNGAAPANADPVKHIVRKPGMTTGNVQAAQYSGPPIN
jgi:hypothetical protein